VSVAAIGKPQVVCHCCWIGAALPCYPHRSRCRGRRWRTGIGGIKIILAGNANEGEQSVAARVGQRGAHALGICRFSNSTYRPVGGDPFAGGVSDMVDKLTTPVSLSIAVV